MQSVWPLPFIALIGLMVQSYALAIQNCSSTLLRGLNIDVDPYFIKNSNLALGFINLLDARTLDPVYARSRVVLAAGEICAYDNLTSRFPPKNKWDSHGFFLELDNGNPESYLPMSYYDACNAMRGLLEYSEKNQKGIYMEKAFLVIRYPRRQKQTLGAGDMLYDESVTTPALAAPTMLTQRDNQELRRQEVKNALQNVLNGGYADCLPQSL